MSGGTSSAGLTGSLEDYLETIYLLIQERRFARVRDIAKARGVKAGSVTPALKRLADLELVHYEQREYIELTARGEEQARRVFARHQLLTRFFREVLQMPAEAADAEACKLEHSLSNQAMDRLVRFFEFLAICPHRPPALLEAFHDCSLVQGKAEECSEQCQLVQAGRVADPAPTATSSARSKRSPRAARARKPAAAEPREHGAARRSVYDLEPGQTGRITHVTARGSARQRLLDMGILPDVEVEMDRVAPSGTPVWIKLRGAQLSLRRSEAEAVLIAAD